MQTLTYFKNLQFNSRAYILALAVVLSIATTSYLRLSIASDQLYLIRLQQLFGLFAVFLLYAAVILTPLSKVFSGKQWLNKLLFARRAIGVSAAYFTLLHTTIAVVDQIGGLSNLVLLPGRFKLAFLLGGIATFILVLMAMTSFDRVIKKMTFRRWKQLHQFVYIAGVFIIIHVWLIGTHADVTAIRIASATALAILFALESNRLVRKYLSRFELSRLGYMASGLALFALMFGSLFLLPVFAGNYHSEHSAEAATTVTTPSGASH